MLPDLDRSVGRRLAALVAAGIALAASVGGVLVSAPAASAYPSTDVTLTGHGYGPGLGMGQWGALGDALAGTSWQQIVEHFYTGSSPAQLSAGQDASTVRVAITENDGNSVIVTSGPSFTVDGSAVGPDQALEMIPSGSTWDLFTGPGCGGPWSQTPFAAGVPDPTASETSASNTLQLCQANGNLTVDGSIEALYNSDGQARTVNTVPARDVRGRRRAEDESPAGWGKLGSTGPGGQPWGFQELEAQAVAVRSYVMASPGSYGGYADICDLSCQTYRGTLNQNALSNLAAQDTAGVVMETGGVIQSTQYSASTGGYTTAGTFAAVPDDGDAVCVPGACNPNHTWTASVPVSTIESTWPQLGALESISITGRNGLGDWGGRVTSLTLVGSSQDVSLTGDDFASALGLRSDWFTVTSTLASSGCRHRIDAGRPGLLDRRIVGSRARVRRCDRPRVGRRHVARRTGGGHGRNPVGPGLLGGRVRRRCVRRAQERQLRLRRVRRGPFTSTGPSWGWLPPRTGAGTGSSRPTAVSSRTAMRTSSARRATWRSTAPSLSPAAAATPDGLGYWLVASDGGVFAAFR